MQIHLIIHEICLDFLFAFCCYFFSPRSHFPECDFSGVIALCMAMVPHLHTTLREAHQLNALEPFEPFKG